MIASKTSQVLKLVTGQAGSRRSALARVMFYLALCLLIGALAPVTVAAPGNDTPRQGPPPQGLPQQGPSTQRLYARDINGVLVSDDTGISWTQAAALPSRPLALAAAHGTPGLVFVGTESLGLYRSNDGGASWRPVDGALLAEDYAAPFAVTALAIDPEDEQIVYAATNVWLGTNPAHLTPLGVAVSVDGGRQWLQLSRAQLGDTPVQRLEPVAGQSLTVLTVNSTGSHTVKLALSPELLGLLQNENPAVRASAARAIGLIGDAAALPALMQVIADPDALAPLVAFPAAIAGIPAETWPLATTAGLLIVVLLAVLAVVLLLEGAAARFGPWAHLIREGDVRRIVDGRIAMRCIGMRCIRSR